MSGTTPKAVVFAYHNVGVRCLSVLLAHGVEVALVITHVDSPNETIWFESVSALAALHGIRVIAPDDPNEPEVVAQVIALHPDFLFSFYYRQMLKAPLLAIPKKGAYNMHGSLLPKYRGRVPVNWAIIHGERETGATLHRMVEKPDAGEIVAQQVIPILPDDTAKEVFEKVTLAAEILLDDVVPALISGTAPHVMPNIETGSYFGGRKPEDGRIDWTKSAWNIHNLIRAVAPPYPGAFCDTAKGRLLILRSLHPTGEIGQFGRPTLFIRNNKLFAECGDRQILRLLSVRFKTLSLAIESEDQLNAIFSTSTLNLT